MASSKRATLKQLEALQRTLDKNQVALDHRIHSARLAQAKEILRLREKADTLFLELHESPITAQEYLDLAATERELATYTSTATHSPAHPGKDMLCIEIFHPDLIDRMTFFYPDSDMLLPYPTGSGYYELHSYETERYFKDLFAPIYQDYWRSQRLLLGYHLKDLYWAQHLHNSGNEYLADHDGSYCTRPANQVLVKNVCIGMLKTIDGEPRFVNTWNHRPELAGNDGYAFLYDLRGDALYTALDLIILS